MEENSEINDNLKDESTFKINDIFRIAIANWYWILISIIICFSIGYLYIASTPNIYTRSASILIKNDSKNKTPNNELFANLDLFQPTTNINDEIVAIESHQIMEEVVRRLKLYDSFSQKDGLKYKSLYGTSPFTIEYNGKESDFTMFIELVDADNVKLVNFCENRGG